MDSGYVLAMAFRHLPLVLSLCTLAAGCDEAADGAPTDSEKDTDSSVEESLEANSDACSEDSSNTEDDGASETDDESNATQETDAPSVPESDSEDSHTDSADGPGSATDTKPGPDDTSAVDSADAGPSSPAEPEGSETPASTPEGQLVTVAVGSWGFRALGTDGGRTWSYCGNPSTGDDHSPDLLRNVGYGDGVFIAVGGDQNSMVMRSVDGVHWEEDLHPATVCDDETYPASCTNWMGGVAYGDGTWLAGGGNGALMRSVDGGYTWKGLNPDPRPPAVRDIAYGSGRFVVGADSGVVGVSDDDGDSWTLHELWEYSFSVVHGDGTFMAWGWNWNGTGFDRACFVSTDAGDEFDPCADDVAEGESFEFDGTRWFATIGDGYAESEDGRDWTLHTADNIPGSLLYDGEQWMGHSGTTVIGGASLSAFDVLAKDVPSFRAWTSGLVLDDALPVEGVAACEDLR